MDLFGLSLTDWLLIATGIGQFLAVLAHAWLAYRKAPERAAVGIEQWLTGERGLGHFDRLLNAWMDSENGRATLSNFIRITAEATKGKLAEFLTGKAGGMKKEFEGKAAGLLEASVSFGNPFLDGAWAAMPKELKRGVLKRLAGVLREKGVAGLDGETETASSAWGT